MFSVDQEYNFYLLLACVYACAVYIVSVFNNRQKE